MSELLIDSGCTSHLIKDADLFRDLDVSKTGKVECANGIESNIKGRGSITFFGKDNQRQDQILEFEESLYVPQYTKNLVSVENVSEQYNLLYLQVDCLHEQSNAAVASL